MLANPFLDPPGRAYDWAEGNPTGTSRVEMVRSSEGKPFNPLLGISGFGEPKTEESRRRALSLGQDIVGFGGSLGGASSKLANLKNLDIAQSLAAKGTIPRTILHKTGWWQDVEGKWKFEISDEGMRLKTEPYEVGQSALAKEAFSQHPATGAVAPGQLHNKRLEDIADFPELFKHYPEFRDLRLGTDVGHRDVLGNWDNATRTVNLSPKWREKDAVEKTLLHEVGGHAVQSREGWGNGANTEMFLPSNFKKQNEFFETVYRDFAEKSALKGYDTGQRVELFETAKKITMYGDEKIGKGDLQRLREFASKNPDEMDFLLDAARRKAVMETAEETAYRNYRKVTGEVEARTVANRKELKASERSWKPFWEDPAFDVRSREQLPGLYLPWAGKP